MKSNRRAVVYIRYILPIVVAGVFFALMFVPYIRFKDVDGLKSAVSLFELLGNSWDTIVEYMFGNGKTNDVTLDFARTVMATVIVMWTTFAIGVASAVYALVSALMYFRNAERIKQRVVFVTLTWNRIGLCALFALTLPIFFFPMLLPYFYTNMLSYPVMTIYSPFNILYVVLALYVLTAVMIAVSKRCEMMEGMNIYTRADKAQSLEQTESCDDDGEEMDEEMLISERMRAEQAERIMRMLRKDQHTDEDK